MLQFIPMQLDSNEISKLKRQCRKNFRQSLQQLVQFQPKMTVTELRHIALPKNNYSSLNNISTDNQNTLNKQKQIRTQRRYNQLQTIQSLKNSIKLENIENVSRELESKFQSLPSLYQKKQKQSVNQTQQFQLINEKVLKLLNGENSSTSSFSCEDQQSEEFDDLNLIL